MTTPPFLLNKDILDGIVDSWTCSESSLEDEFGSCGGYKNNNDDLEQLKRLIPQILENQKIVERLREFLRDPLNNPEAHGIVFHNPEYSQFLKEILGDSKQ